MSGFFSGNKKIIAVISLVIVFLVAVAVKLWLEDNAGSSRNLSEAVSQETGNGAAVGRESEAEFIILTDVSSDASRSAPQRPAYMREEKRDCSNSQFVKRFHEWASAGDTTSDRRELAVIIDDLGQSMTVFDKLILLDFDITYSVLPLLPYSEKTAETAFRNGREVMLHLPMEPKEALDNNPGKGALFVDDAQEVIRQKIAMNLRSVPHASGVNNHMGSLFTLNAPGLKVLMEFLSEDYLFFVDSKTAPGNLAKNTAHEYEVPYFARDIFLDNVQDESCVAEQLFRAVGIVLGSGWSIAIGHPHEVTYHVLAKYLHVIEKSGIQIVSVGDLL